MQARVAFDNPLEIGLLGVSINPMLLRTGFYLYIRNICNRRTKG
jgi:hypothetical protein